MKAKNILFITQEIAPFVQESPLALTGRELPQLIQEKNHEIRTFTPKWGTINERRNQLHEVIRLSGMNLIINETDHPLIIKVASLQSARIQVYFIDNDDYFQNRLMVEDDSGVEYTDNDERTIFFARGVLETVKKLRWTPDVIHCHGWISALVPLFIKSAYKDEPSFRDSKIIYSLYDNTFSTAFPTDFTTKLLCKGMKADLVKEVVTPIDYEELSKLAIRYSDGVIQNSENVSSNLLEYAKSINKPLLLHQPTEQYAAACNDFYETVF